MRILLAPRVDRGGDWAIMRTLLRISFSERKASSKEASKCSNALVVKLVDTLS